MLKLGPCQSRHCPSCLTSGAGRSVAGAGTSRACGSSGADGELPGVSLSQCRCPGGRVDEVAGDRAPGRDPGPPHRGRGGPAAWRRACRPGVRRTQAASLAAPRAGGETARGTQAPDRGHFSAEATAKSLGWGTGRSCGAGGSQHGGPGRLLGRRVGDRCPKGRADAWPHPLDALPVWDCVDRRP